MKLNKFQYSSKSSHIKYSVIAFISIASFHIISCQHFGHIKGEPHTIGEPKYNPNQRPKVGSKYYCNTSNTTTTSFEFNGNEAENTNKVEAGLIYEIISDTADGSLVKITYDNFQVKVKTADSEKEMTSNNGPNSIDPVEQMLALLKGGSLFVTINKKGQVTNVEGYKQLTNKIMNGVLTENEVDRQKMTAQLQDMFGENFIKNNMEQGFGLLPDTGVYLGDSWVQKQTQITPIKLTINSTYTLSSLNENVAEIDANANINTADSNVTLMGYQANVTLSGSEEGNYKADRNTGMLIEGKFKISMKGNLQIQMRTVPLEIKEEKITKIKQL